MLSGTSLRGASYPFTRMTNKALFILKSKSFYTCSCVSFQKGLVWNYPAERTTFIIDMHVPFFYELPTYACLW
jgi:hypothetical protein